MVFTKVKCKVYSSFLMIDLTTGGLTLYRRPLQKLIEWQILSRSTFSHLCHLLSSVIPKQNTNMHASLSVEKCVAITLWFLATPGEYRTIAHLFRIAHCTACVFIHETCSAIVHV